MYRSLYALGRPMNYADQIKYVPTPIWLPFMDILMYAFSQDHCHYSVITSHTYLVLEFLFVLYCIQM